MDTRSSRGMVEDDTSGCANMTSDELERLLGERDALKREVDDLRRKLWIERAELVQSHAERAVLETKLGELRTSEVARRPRIYLAQAYAHVAKGLAELRMTFGRR